MVQTTTYVYDEADRLLSKTKGTETTLYTWDNDGNLLTKGDQTFTWNKAGKLAAWADGTNSSSYAYDGDGVRVNQTNNGTATNYLQDLGAGMAVVLREEENGEFRDYVYGLDLISQQDSTVTNYLLTDGLGSTRLLTNKIGDVTGRYVYDVFGAERTYSGTDQTDFTFAGEQMDKTSGLQYLRARYYDPEDGRFISVDPIQYNPYSIQTYNRYVYGLNNPIKFIDPKGESVLVAAAAGVGAFFGGVIIGTAGQFVSDVVDNMAEMRPVSDWEYSDLATYWASGLSGGLDLGVSLINKFAGKVLGSGSKPFLKDYLEDGRVDNPWQDLSEGSKKATISIISNYFMEYSGMSDGIKDISKIEFMQKLYKKGFSTIFFKKPMERLLKYFDPDPVYGNFERGFSGGGGSSWGTAPSGAK